jgi:fructose-1,6-bisphosphatase I
MASTASAALAASSGIVSSSCSNRLVTSVSNSSGGGGGGGVSSSFLHPLVRTGTSFRGSVVGLTVRGGQEGNWTNRRWSGNGGGGGGGRVVTTAAVSVEPPPVPKQQKRSQYEIETFTGWLLRQEQIGVIDAELTIVLSSISVACKQIASLVQRAGISNLTGLQGASNIQGEDQKKLDVISNEVLLSLSLSLFSSWTKHNPIPSITFSSSSLLRPSYASRHYRRMWFFSHKRPQVMTHVCVR